MNRKSLFFTCCLFLVFCSQAGAYDFELDGIYYNLINHGDGGVEVTYKEEYGPTYIGNIVIPSQIRYNYMDLEVTAIGDKAFAYCVNLRSVKLPDGMKTIGEEAFAGCEMLSTITLPPALTKIGNYAFNGCLGLQSLTIPKSVIDIGYYDTFSYCPSLSSITVEEGNPVYDSRRNCNAIIRTADNELLYASSTTVIPSGVTRLRDGAFANCLVTELDIPNTVTKIGESCFINCIKLESILLSRSITEIPANAFNFCSNLKEIDIPSSVTKIGEGAFSDCQSLESVILPKSLASMGDYAFIGASALRSVTCRSTAPSMIPSTCWLTPYASNEERAHFQENVTLYVPIGARSTYANLTGWEVFGNIVEIVIPEEISGIEETTHKMMGADHIFSISGQRLSTPAKGINIINGKKILVR